MKKLSFIIAFFICILSSSADAQINLDVEGETKLQGLTEIIGGNSGPLGGFGSSGMLQLRNPGMDINAGPFITGHNSVDGNTQLWYMGSGGVNNQGLHLYNRQNSFINFGTNNAFRMTISADGDVGIGTPTPNATLEVVGGSPGIVGEFGSGVLQIRNPDTDANAVAAISGHNSASSNTQLWFLGSLRSTDQTMALINRQNDNLEFWTNDMQRVVIDNNGVTEITASRTDAGIVGGFGSGSLQLKAPETDANAGVSISGHNSASGNSQNWYLGDISSSSQEISFINRNDADLSFWTDNSERMTIEADGDVGIGTSIAFGKLHSKQSTNDKALVFENDGDGNDFYSFDIVIDDLRIGYDADGPTGGTSFPQIAYINEDGAYVDSSDRRLKDNIKPLEDNILEKVLKLRPKTYTFKHLRNKGTRSMGFIAQEVQEVFPDIARVSEYKDYMALRYDDFAILSIKAIQEQQTIIQEKEARITQIEQELADLKQLVQQVLGENNASPSKPNTASTILHEPATLKQNQPNPFTENTLIEYHLPKGTLAAQLQITNPNGQVIQVIVLEGIGEGQVNLKSGTLTAGSYFYSLIIDGKVVDTKQMVLTK